MEFLVTFDIIEKRLFYITMNCIMQQCIINNMNYLTEKLLIIYTSFM